MENEDSENEYESEAIEDDSDFLHDLNSDVFKPTLITDQESVKQKRQEEREMKLVFLQEARDLKREIRERKAIDLAETRLAKKQSKVNKKNGVDDDSDELFSGNSPTPILGKEKLLLLKKVAQYKSLFPQELKTFKIKKNPTPNELSAALEEMSVLVEVSSMDGFLMDSVFSCMKLIEGASSMTQHDIRGCADMLKQNKEFHKLSKTLFIKYNVFSSVPPEFQLLLLVSTTGYMCSQKNRINDYLNSTI